jgi:hypothetical protein
MTDLRDAAEKALKALEMWKDDAPSWWTTGDEKTITALKAALEQPEQEPVAWMVYTQDGKSVCVTDNPADFIEWRSFPLFTHPPRREWRGLSKDESLKLWGMRSDGPSNLEIIGFARAVEAALKEKNHD